MPLLYIAISHRGINNTKGIYDFKALQEDTHQPGKLWVHREISLINIPEANLFTLSSRFYTYANLPSKSNFFRFQNQSAYPIYCIDIPNVKAYEEFKREEGAYLDIQQCSIVGYYTCERTDERPSKVQYNLILNKAYQGEGKYKFYTQIADEVNQSPMKQLNFGEQAFPAIYQHSLAIEKAALAANKALQKKRAKVTALKLAGLFTLLTLGGLLLTGVTGYLLLVFFLTAAISSYLLFGSFVAAFVGGVVLSAAGIGCTYSTLRAVMKSDAELDLSAQQVLGDFSQPTSASAYPVNPIQTNGHCSPTLSPPLTNGSDNPFAYPYRPA